MSKVIGIDLGTTNSCVAVVEGGKPVVITNAEGERTTPSVVAFTKDGERLVGGAAKRQIATNSGRTISSIKRHMGSDYRVHIDGKDLTPQEISAMILAKIRRDAESYLGEPVTEAVITVPAYFDDSQRKATQDAGRIAGLNVLRIINEPTAAAVAYGLDNEAAQKILVYDLGGGTFDVSIIEIEDGTFTVLATGGDTHLGGDDFDQRIVEYAVAEFKKSDRIDLSRDPAAMGRLKEEAEKAKKELSAAPSAQLNLPFIAVGKDGPHHLDISLSRPQFEMMTGDLLARTVAPVQNALRDAGISASQLGKVLLVGGSTRMPAVERQVKELLGCEPSHSLNPDECVAMGAAVQGGLLQGGGKLAGATGAAAQGLVLMDVTPLTLSIETLGGVATPLITRNSMIPTRKSQIFTTARPMQTSVEINVLQGERHFARDNKSLGKFKLTGIRASFSSKPQIEVTFDIDVNGVVKVSAKDLGTGREQNITITGSTNLSENEIQRAMADAAAYEAEDSRRKERLDLHNQAEVLAYKVDEALSKCKKELDKDEKNRIKTDLANLRRCLRKDKPEKMNENEEANLRQAKTQLEESANHLMVLQHLRKECFQSGMLRVGEQFLRRLVLLDLAVVDEDDAVGHLAGEAHLVGDHQHGDAGVGKLLHQFQNLAHHFGVEGAGGLVEQDHVRVHGKGTGNGNTLLLAAGKALGVGIGLVGQTHAGQKFVCLGGDGFPYPSASAGWGPAPDFSLQSGAGTG